MYIHTCLQIKPTIQLIEMEYMDLTKEKENENPGGSSGS